MRLHVDKELFDDLIEATAASLNIPAIYVEKDYWVTYILKKLSLSDYGEVAIFKGGTSLSKAYNLIERFSEDIDLAVIVDGKTGNQIKALIRHIEKQLLDDNFKEILTHQTSKGSQFRKTLYEYPKIKEGLFGHANENIIIELNSFAMPHPFGKKTIVSYIGAFLADKDVESINAFALEPFEVNVLDYRRTFCEKLSAVARASYESDKNLSELKEKIRHFYDIHYLMQEENIVNFLDSNAFVEMIKAVRSDDTKQFQTAQWALVVLHETEIFANPKGVLDKLEHFYNDNFSQLVYAAEMPSVKTLIQTMEKIATILKEKDL